MKSTSKTRTPSTVNLTVKRRYLTEREVERLMGSPISRCQTGRARADRPGHPGWQCCPHSSLRSWCALSNKSIQYEARTPDLSIEVDNLDEIHQRAVAAGLSIEYGPTSVPWGVRRFYVRDPFGRLLNILAHES